MTTKIAIGEVLALMLPLLFVGCLSTTAEVVIEPYEPETIQTEYSNNSHHLPIILVVLLTIVCQEVLFRMRNKGRRN